jgi:hypothetical protein
MKINYLLLVLLASMIAITSCQDPDDLIKTDSENALSIKGSLVSNATINYDAIIDDANGIVTVQVPYYISDTEKIQGDLTQMKLQAALPVGSQFQPSISGIHDLVAGIQSTLVNEDGTRTTYTIKAVYVKSPLAKVTKAELTDYERATIRIVEPETEGGTGKIIVYKTSSAIDVALKSATLAISPWATIESSAMNPTTGIIDLSGQPAITITAQNGTDKTIYQTSVELPDLLAQGVGYTASLFGFQIYTDDAHGFEAGTNRTMAVIGDYLIISNSSDYTKMIVMNRYNGKVLEVKVNTTGIDAGRSIHAITSDDTGHLVAMAYTSTLDNAVTNPSVRAWVWDKGIESAPKSIVYADINGSTFASAPMGINNVTKLDLGRTICVKGDLTSGDAIIATSSKSVPRPVFLMFKNGTMQGKAYVEWSGGQVSMWNATKIIPITNTSPLGYIWATANFRQGVHYTPVGTGTRAIEFSLPASHWWAGSGPAAYDKNVRGIDYIEFNGTYLLGVQNGWTSNTVWYHRLYVSNITNSPGASSMANGFIFDSREGNSSGTGQIPGTGYAVTGMTSSASFVSGKQVLGPNTDETGDVVFGVSPDGNAVQVYMLTTDQGIFAYEITKFDL